LSRFDFDVNIFTLFDDVVVDVDVVDLIVVAVNRTWILIVQMAVAFPCFFQLDFDRRLRGIRCEFIDLFDI